MSDLKKNSWKVLQTYFILEFWMKQKNIAPLYCKVPVPKNPTTTMLSFDQNPPKFPLNF